MTAKQISSYDVTTAQNSSYSRVPKTFLVDCWLCVECYYHTTPTNYPSPTRGTTVGLPVAVNINFCEYLRFLSISFVWSIWYSMPLTTFLVNNFCLFHRPVLIFQLTVTAGQAINKGELCLEQHYSLNELHSCYVSTHVQGFWKRLGGGVVHSGYTEKRCHGSCSLPKHCSISDRIEQNSSNFDTLFATSL